jgi:antitoxin component of MazEF toxin-antitoxin module
MDSDTFDSLVIQDVRKAPATDLAALLERITPENVHAGRFDELTSIERW